MAKKYKAKNRTKKIVAGIVAVVLAIAALAGIIALFRPNTKDEKVEIKPAFSVGALDENGKYKKSDSTLYTKEAFDAEGLEAQLKFDATISYQFFYYDEDVEFLSSSGTLNVNHVAVLPEGAEYARIMIMPDWTGVEVADQEIGALDKSKYTSQIKFLVNNPNYVEEETEDEAGKELLYFNLRNDNATVGAGPLGEDLSVPIEHDGSGYAVSDLITIDSSKTYVLTVNHEGEVYNNLMNNSNVQDCIVLVLHFYDAAGNPIEATYTVSGETYTEEYYDVYNLTELWDWSESCSTYEFGFDGNSGFELSDTPAYMVVNATSELLNWTIPSLTVK